MQINEKDFLSFITVKQALAGNTVRHCRIRFRLINKWFIEKELTKDNVEKFFIYLIEKKKLKNSSLNTYRFVFRHIKEYCSDRGLPDDFFNGFKAFKKVKPSPEIFTPEEIEKILNTSLIYGKFEGKDCSFLDFRYRTLTMFLAYTGCRDGEALNLKINKLNLSAGRATFIDTKTRQDRTVFLKEPLTDNMAKLIAGRKPEDYVFINARNNQINLQDYSQDLKKRAKAAGVTGRIFPHKFRHSYITHLLEAGVSITEVATLAGHRDIQTTFSVYMHLADKTLERAAMRHPLVRKNIDPHEIIKLVKETVENLHLATDPRFHYFLSQEENGLSFKLKMC